MATILPLRKEIKKSLKIQIIFYALISVVFSLICFFVLYAASLFATKNYIESKGNDKTFTAAANEFQKYINQNNIASTDLAKVSDWSSKENDVFVLHTVSNEKFDKQETAHKGNKTEGIQSNIIIQYSDGAVLTNFLLIRSHAELNFLIIISLAVSFLLFIFLFYKLLKRKLDYIAKIESGVAILESGNLTYRIPVQGQDELERLALSINEMSKSLRERIVSEQSAVQSNKEIIGDLSHDIRTPLTILSGYIPILLESTPLTETQKEYLNLIAKKTKQMDNRVNELLEYATLFSGQQKPNKTPLDANMLIEQLAHEIKSFVEIHITNNILQGTQISGDATMLSRLFDNIVSNIKKHGDLSKPVKLSAKTIDNKLCFKIENTVSENSENTGKSLGLKICRFILDSHNGEIQSEISGKLFRTVISLPCAK